MFKHRFSWLMFLVAIVVPSMNFTAKNPNPFYGQRMREEALRANARGTEEFMQRMQQLKIFNSMPDADQDKLAGRALAPITPAGEEIEGLAIFLGDQAALRRQYPGNPQKYVSDEEVAAKKVRYNALLDASGRRQLEPSLNYVRSTFCSSDPRAFFCRNLARRIFRDTFNGQLAEEPFVFDDGKQEFSDSE